MGGKKLGRPRNGDDAKTTRIAIRVSPEESAALLRAAELDGSVPGERPPQWYRRKLLEAADVILNPAVVIPRATAPIRVVLGPELRAAVEEYCRATGINLESMVASLLTGQLTEMRLRLSQMQQVLGWRDQPHQLAPRNPPTEST